MTKGEGTFADAHKYMINPFILSNVFPEDVRAFVFEEDWCMNSKDAAIREMRHNPRWNKLLRLDPQHPFWDGLSAKLTPEEFLCQFQEYTEAHEVEPLHNVVGESPGPSSKSAPAVLDTPARTEAIEDEGEPSAASTASASRGAPGLQRGSRSRGAGGEPSATEEDMQEGEEEAAREVIQRNVATATAETKMVRSGN